MGSLDIKSLGRILNAGILAEPAMSRLLRCAKVSANPPFRILPGPGGQFPSRLAGAFPSERLDPVVDRGENIVAIS